MLKSHAPNGNINFSFKRGRSSHAFFVAFFALPRCTTIPSTICLSACRLRQAKMPGTARPSHLRIMKTQHNYPRKCRPNSTRLWTTNRWLGRGTIVRESSSSRTACNIASAFCHQVLQARCNCEVFPLLKAGVKLKVAWHVPTFIFKAVILTFCQELAPVSLFLRMR